MSRLWLDKFQSSAWALDKTLKSNGYVNKSKKMITEPIHALRFCFVHGKDDEMKELISKCNSACYLYGRYIGHDKNLMNSITDKDIALKYCLNIKFSKQLKKLYNSKTNGSISILTISILASIILLLILGVPYYFEIILDYGILSKIGIVSSVIYLLVLILSTTIMHYLICVGRRIDRLITMTHSFLNYDKSEVGISELITMIDIKLRNYRETDVNIDSSKILDQEVVNRGSF